MHDAQLNQVERGDEIMPFGKTAEEILTDVAKVLGFENTKTFLTVRNYLLYVFLSFNRYAVASLFSKLLTMGDGFNESVVLLVYTDAPEICGDLSD